MLVIAVCMNKYCLQLSCIAPQEWNEWRTSQTTRLHRNPALSPLSLLFSSLLTRKMKSISMEKTFGQRRKSSYANVRHFLNCQLIFLISQPFSANNCDSNTSYLTVNCSPLYLPYPIFHSWFVIVGSRAYEFLFSFSLSLLLPPSAPMIPTMATDALSIGFLAESRKNDDEKGRKSKTKTEHRENPFNLSWRRRAPLSARKSLYLVNVFISVRILFFAVNHSGATSSPSRRHVLTPSRCVALGIKGGWKNDWLCSSAAAKLPFFRLRQKYLCLILLFFARARIDRWTFHVVSLSFSTYHIALNKVPSDASQSISACQE